MAKKEIKPICGSLVSSTTPKLNMTLKVAMLRSDYGCAKILTA